MNRLFGLRAMLTLIVVMMTTVQMAAWQRTPPTYCIDFVKGGLGEVVVQGWAFDPYASDQEIQLVVVAYTQPNDSYEGYETVSTEDGYEHLIQRFPVESVNSVYNVNGNHGFRLQLPVYAHLFGEENELTMYVKIYARTFEYNPYNPNCKDYEYLLRTQDDSPFTTVKVVRNEGNDGTEEHPYQIYNAKHWDAIADVVNDVSLNAFYADKYFQLYDEEGYDYNDPTPVTKMFGTSTRPFTGTFDGKGKTVNVNLSGTMHVAPFASTEGATIKNLTVTGNISASWSAGGIVGDGGSGTLNLQNCVCSANISGFYNFAGGLMGWTEEDLTLNISNCLFKGTFTPGDGGKYHPIAIKSASSAVKARAVNAYYVNTISPSSGLGRQTLRNATGIPLSNTCVPGEWDEEIIAADGQSYYAIHFNGKGLPYSYGFENNDLEAEGWTRQNGGGIISVGHEGTHSYRFDSNESDLFLISPELYFYSAITLSFYYRIPDSDGFSCFQVGYSFATNDLDEFVWDEEIIVNPSSNFYRYERTFPQGTKYVAVKCRRHFDGCSILFVDDFCFTNCTSPYPASIGMTELTDKSVSLTWESPVESDVNGYSYQYKKRNEDSWSAESYTTDLYANLIGLSPNTDYDFRVRAYSNDKTGGFVNYNFTTTIELPYSYGFENGFFGFLMGDGWLMANCYVGAVALDYDDMTGIRTYAHRDGGKGFAFDVDFYNMTSPQYLITPRLPEDSPILMSFYFKDSRPEAHPELLEKFKVGYSTTTNDINAFTWGEETSARGTDWTEFKETFPEGTRYIAVAYTNQVRGLYIDDFSFYRYSYKPKPTNIAVSNLTDQSVTFTWKAPDASATGYAYQYKLATETGWTAEAMTTGTFVTLDGLTPNTTYDFRVKTIFSDGVSNYVTQRFITESPAVTSFPYTEGFENGMGGWRLMSAHVSSKIYSKTPEDVRSGNCSFQFYPESAVNGIVDGQYLISPQFDGKSPLKLTFYYKDFEGHQAYFQVGYSTSKKESISDFHWFSSSITNANWQKYTIYCPAGTKYVAIRWIHGYYLYLDDFTFEETDVTPTTLFEVAATDITATSADVNWTRNAENFEFKYREKAFFLDDSEEGSEPWTTTGLGFWRTLTLTVGNNVNHVTQSTNILYTADQNGNVIQTDIVPVDTWRVSPKVSLTGTLSFLARYYNETFDESTDTCEVLVSTTVNNNCDAFTPIGFISHTTTEDFFNMNYYSCSLDSYNGQEGYIAFRHKSHNRSWLILDDIAIYRTTDEWTTLTTTENNVKLTGLEPTTGYEFQVRPLLFDNSSSWTNVITFTTEDYKLLAGNADNSAAIGAIADGKKHDVMLQDYTFSCKRDDWNTLCLPFDVTDFDDTDGITFSGTPLEGATVKALTGSSFSDDVLTTNFNEVTSIEAGKPYIVKWVKGADIVIKTGDDWTRFVSRVAEGETFAGMNVTLDSDINVISMVGTADHPFCGTFDGNGHTLNVNIDQSGVDYAAPFQYINGATIRNVKVTGSVSGGQYCAGIAGKATGGTNSIRNCWMSASVTSQGNIGGVLGHGTTSSTTISNCYLDGSLNGENIGVYSGGCSVGGTFTAENCWADGTYNVNGGGINLVMTDEGTVNFTNCRNSDSRINQGDYYYSGLVIVLYIEDAPSDSQYVSFLGNQWGLNDNGELIINPSADLPATSLENPVFKEVVVNQNSPSALSLSQGEFGGAYSPVSSLTDVLFDAHNAGNKAFHAAFSYDRASLGDDFVNWYNDVTLTSPATVIPFDADGNVTLYAGRWLELADDASDNSQTVESAVNSGKTVNRVVVLKDRQIYRDEDWNTLCLPFGMNEAQIASSPLVGATIMELDGNTSRLAGGTLTLNFKEAYSIEAGRPYIIRWLHPVVVIDSESAWDAFAAAVNNGSQSYAGKLVQLTADLSVSTMVGTADHPFCGTFDGNGHTLNVNIDQSGVEYAAPFRYINGATIRNLKVTGAVAGGQHCAGIAGAALGGVNSIRNCWMAASVTTSGNSIGGVLGHGTTSVVTISNCYLNSLLKGGSIGVFCGGGYTGGKFTVMDCWTLGDYNYDLLSGGINLVKTEGGTVSVVNCQQNSEYISQGSNIGLIIVLYGNLDPRIAQFLGVQWTLDGNGYLMLKPSAEYDNTVIESPKFTDVNIDATVYSVSTRDKRVTFKGTFDYQSFATENRSVLFLGGENTLYYPDGESNVSIGAFRAYFELASGVTAGDAADAIRAFVLNFGDNETTGINSLTPDPSPRGEGSGYYTLDGRKIDGQPKRKGLYIHGNKKVVIK